MKIGEVPRVKWYVLKDGRVVSLHQGYNSERAETGKGEVWTTFFSEQKTLPSVTARRLGYDFEYIEDIYSFDYEDRVNKFFADIGVEVERVIEV